MEEEKTPRMAKIKETAASHWWLFDSHLTSRRSHWLQSTLQELDEKTSSMLKIVEEDADSFAQRAEMYYKKRPELISMVEDFYRMHRSLAEKYDQLKSEAGVRSPFASKYRTEMFSASVRDQISDSQSEVYDPDDGAKSEVDDPDHEDERERIVKEYEYDYGEVMQETEADDQRRDELMELRDELERVKQENLIQMEQLLRHDEEQRELLKKLRKEMGSIKQENLIQRDQLLQKDEEKREVIRQLSSAMELIRLENSELRKMVVQSQKKKNSFQFEKLKEAFMDKVFNVCAPKSQGTVVAL